MKTTSPAAAAALATLYAKEKLLVDRSFSNLTGESLRTLDQKLLREANELLTDRRRRQLHDLEGECHSALARACIRRAAHGCLRKYARLVTSREVVEDALKFHALPPDLRERLATKYGGGDAAPAPTTWYEALEQLKALATKTTTNSSSADDRNDDCGPAEPDKGKLWRLLSDHPMTAYVPVQCQSCGHVVPDQYPMRQSDAEVGLEEVPLADDEVEPRAGWFRGPRGAVAFRLTCQNCGNASRWYRSGHPRVMLNPRRWGRLCGEQEDLRLTLASYLNIPVRLVVPLDWDHVWSEYRAPSPSGAADEPSSSPPLAWQVEDGSARNFCRRLDEGIGSWTGVWAVHPDADWCRDVTGEYLACRRDGGRADDDPDTRNSLERYEGLVRCAREDGSGSLTQAKTVNGYAIERANLSDEDVTRELRRAALDYGTREWWQLDDGDI